MISTARATSCGRPRVPGGDLRDYPKERNIEVDWQGSRSARPSAHQLPCMISPFGVPEKQALLDAENLEDARETLTALTENRWRGVAAANGGNEPRQQ